MTSIPGSKELGIFAFCGFQSRTFCYSKTAKPGRPKKYAALQP